MSESEASKATEEASEASKKAKQDLMTRILGWGMIVYFLVLGYSINQSSLFELRAKDEQGNVANAKLQQAAVLRKQSNIKGNMNAEAAENVKAAELELEARKLNDETSDGQSRAVGLIIAATTFLVFYVFLIHKFYERFKAQRDGFIVSRKMALAYAIFIGGSIWFTAFMVAFF